MMLKLQEIATICVLFFVNFSSLLLVIVNFAIYNQDFIAFLISILISNKL